MLLKSADDKSKRLKLLEELQKSPNLDFSQKKWLKDELHRFKKGIQGERESAHYLDAYFKDGENHVLLHDLRFIVDGDVAQIDHLFLNRAGHVFLIETKNYSGDIIVNELGEFTVQYDDDLFGIPSPLEQSRRHERVVVKLLERLEIGGRVERQMTFHHVVMMHPKSIIKRPDPKVFDTSFLIKSDQFPSWHTKFGENLGAGTIIKAIFNIRNLGTVVEWGEKLKRQHRPQDLLALPDFMKPKVEPAIPQVESTRAVLVSEPSSMDHDAPAKKLICAQCGSKITYQEGKFCWNNDRRFKGLQYCREHQGMFQPQKQ